MLWNRIVLVLQCDCVFSYFLLRRNVATDFLVQLLISDFLFLEYGLVLNRVCCSTDPSVLEELSEILRQSSVEPGERLLNCQLSLCAKAYKT